MHCYFTMPGQQRRLHYTAWGDQNSPVLVFCVHGLTRNGRDFDYLAQHLQRHCRVICIDIAGRGKSDWLPEPSDYNYTTYLADCGALLKALLTPHTQQVFWVGTSMGGLLGMLAAGGSLTPLPLAKLVLNDVGYRVPVAALARLASYVGVTPSCASVAAWEAHLRNVCAGFGPLDDAAWHHLAVHSCYADAEGLVHPSYDPRIAHAFKGPLAEVDLTPAWQAVTCPVLVIRGENSDVLPAAQAQQMQARPNVQLVEIAATGHAPMLMKGDEIQQVADFLLT